MSAAAVKEQDQEQVLEAAMREVKQNAFKMKRSLDNNNLMEGIKHASTMLLELRTNIMSPKTYYELCTACDAALSCLATAARTRVHARVDSGRSCTSARLAPRAPHPAPRNRLGCNRRSPPPGRPPRLCDRPGHARTG